MDKEINWLKYFNKSKSQKEEVRMNDRAKIMEL